MSNRARHRLIVAAAFAGLCVYWFGIKAVLVILLIVFSPIIFAAIAVSRMNWERQEERRQVIRQFENQP